MNTRVLTINGGSSSIKFAIFEPGAGMERLLSGGIEGIGLAQGKFVAKGREPADNFSRPSTTPDHVAAVNLLMDWMEKRIERGSIAAVSHRVVHGGPKHWEPVRVTEEVLADLRQISPFDPEHLPEEILLIEAFQRHLSEVPQVACFDTAFHHDLPRVARLLPLPRRYESAGLRRYGFHGLSCTYVMEELARLAGREPAAGRVVICHLGNGASITAVHSGRSMDTSMAFTPAAGLPMSTRAGDLDPGIPFFLARTENLSPEQFNHMVNHESGLLGISETSSDMRDLISREDEDMRAGEAVALFCYQAAKWVSAMAAALEGLDTLIFAGGIGENSPRVRERICRRLAFLGVTLVPAANESNAPLISETNAALQVRIIPTDEEVVLARSAVQVLGLGGK